MEQKEALRIIFDGADKYKDNLENKNLLFLIGTKEKVEGIETVFLGKNYLHLTGVELSRERFKSSIDFFRACIDKRLSVNDFSVSLLTGMKLQVLPQLMQIEQNAKIAGEYDHSKLLLYTDIMIGSISACMGFVKDKDYYIPNTVLKEDIRNITLHPNQRVLAILKKDVESKAYKQVTYLAKGVSLKEPRIAKLLVSRHDISINSAEELRLPLNLLLKKAKAEKVERVKLEDRISSNHIRKKEKNQRIR